MKQLHLIIWGKVQGVYYRASCLEMAVNLNLKGWVRNLPDGNVEVLAEGKEENLNKLIDWCKKGPPHSRVDNLEISWNEIENCFNDFCVR